MATSVVPYSEIEIKEGKEIYSVIRLNSFHSDILVSEEYCVNPHCNCNDVLLRFFELSDGVPINQLFTLRVDLSTWKVTERTVTNQVIDADPMIKDFTDNIDQLKGLLLSHYRKAKEYGKKNYALHIPESTVKLILEGSMLSYSEIFGAIDLDHLSFEFNKTERWMFDDQYCSNPQCLCNEAVLSFYKIDLTKKTQESDFAVRLNIKNFNYDIEYNKSDPDKIAEIIQFLKDSRPDVLVTIKRRYSEVKNASKRVLKESSLKEKKEVAPIVRIGRNDPCPCGSGKKYKKCCGNNI